MPAASKLRATEKLGGESKKQQQARKPSAYNPMSGTFHLVDALEPSIKLKSLDDASSMGCSSELDSVSNNGSCSGESEDQQIASKAKAAIPGLEASPDKQEKTRLKNERKHQRQKERKVKELKDRCAGYLMSRKLERLAQELVVMGFPGELATMALILNEGDLEKSISLLVEDEAEKNLQRVFASEVRLKLDISDELARIADIEARYGFPLADVERAVVGFEGDTESAFRWLLDHHSDNVSAQAPNQQHHQHQNHQQQPLHQQQHFLSEQHQNSVKVQAPGAGVRQLQLQQHFDGLKLHPGFNNKAPPPSIPPSQVWQRSPTPPPPSSVHEVGDNRHFHSVPPVVANRLDPAAMKFLEQRERADWRSSHPSQVMMNRGGGMIQRLNEPHLMKQQQHQELFPPTIRHQLYNHISPSAAAAAAIIHHQQQHHQQQQHQQQQHQQQQMNNLWHSAAVNQSDSWNVSGASRVDYQAIDWSVGLPRSPYASKLPTTSLGLGIPRVRNDQAGGRGGHQQPQSGYHRELPLPEFVQEWTTPFTGKDLFQHQPVPSL